MNKFLLTAISIIIILVGISMVANIQLTTRVGINYQWQEINLPLYLKVLNFLDRHFNSKQLIKRIIKDIEGEEERALEIFEWTHSNIRKVPEGLPIIDDHVWHTIVRGYGAPDQVADVFATLCNYAGISAYYSKVGANNKKIIFLTFVQINKKWTVFDSFNGVYFKNSKGDFATIDNFKNRDWSLSVLSGKKIYLDYEDYLINLSDIDDVPLNRANIQSPFNRILFALKRWLRLSKNLEKKLNLYSSIAIYENKS